MKKIVLLAIFACLSLFAKAQKITVDLDSVSENKVFVTSVKWKKSTDTVLVITYKVNGQVYGDSSVGNFNMTFEWALDSVKGFTGRKAAALAEREKEIRQLEEKLLKAYEKNKEVDPKLRNRDAQRQGAQMGFMGDMPKSDNSDLFKAKNPINFKTDTTSAKPKRKWWQRKK